MLGRGQLPWLREDLWVGGWGARVLLVSPLCSYEEGKAACQATGFTPLGVQPGRGDSDLPSSCVWSHSPDLAGQ